VKNESSRHRTHQPRIGNILLYPRLESLSALVRQRRVFERFGPSHRFWLAQHTEAKTCPTLRAVLQHMHRIVHGRTQAGHNENAKQAANFWARRCYYSVELEATTARTRFRPWKSSRGAGVWPSVGCVSKYDASNGTKVPPTHCASSEQDEPTPPIAAGNPDVSTKARITTCWRVASATNASVARRNAELRSPAFMVMRWLHARASANAWRKPCFLLIKATCDHFTPVVELLSRRSLDYTSRNAS
jgi:hypothetical protein